jgi:hypothetical protein
MLLAVMATHLAVSHASYSWWSLGIQDCAASYERCSSCAETDTLTPSQQKMCSQHGDTEVVQAISRGILESIRDCQRKFSNAQWNCTTFNGDHLFGRFTENGTRETAILNAFLSAGATHGLASACHDNTIDRCPCEVGETRRENGMTLLQSCSDNVKFAIGFVKDFYGLEDSTAEADLVDSWNNEIGYEACDNRTLYCRCTGLSGSCVVKTCYMRAPEIVEIGEKLRSKYAGSQKVVAENGTLHIATSIDHSPISIFPCHIMDTPSLCDPDPENGILGTSGRKCYPTSSGPDSCANLCCNGFREITYEVIKEKCRFQWCCRIVCDPLPPMEVTEYECL